MIPIHIYNTLTGKMEPFLPIDENKVKIYVCGVTVYDRAHIGHLRPAVTFNSVARALRFLGYQPKIVVNFTDIDDKIIHKSVKENRSWNAVSEEFIQTYLDDLKNFGLDEVEARPRASHHLKGMESHIQTLLQKEIAYQDNQGNTWFEVRKFPTYGKLSNQDINKLAGSPQDTQEGGKKNPEDFCLWKAAKSGEPFFESSLGLGRPGWHIECSAMIHDLLGETIDIHAGGMDLVFPHHENEKAQSEAATGKPLSNYWMHIGLVTLGGEKMAKSIGNVFWIKDLAKKYTRNALLHFFHTTLYRSPLEFSEKKMADSEKACLRLKKLWNDVFNSKSPPILQETSVEPPPSSQKLTNPEALSKELFTSICEDFNFPKLVGFLFIHLKNLKRDKLALTPKILNRYREVLLPFIDILGFELETENSKGKAPPTGPDSGPVVPDPKVEELLELLLQVRKGARNLKLFEISDQIRKGLETLGYTIEDGPFGTRCVKS